MTDALYAEALSTFGTLYQEAVTSGTEAEANAMTVATATSAGLPDARTVLLKNFDEHGFVFYTHLDSPKGRDLQSNPHAALLFLWRTLREAGIQVRVQGKVAIVDDAEADAYFATRARMSQIGAWASHQSDTLSSQGEFDRLIAETEARFQGQDVPRPPSWSGFRVQPSTLEFWYGAKFRLHERWRYERAADGSWSKRMLFP